MRTLKVTVAYDGAGYAGWQRQNGAPTIQALLEAAFKRDRRARGHGARRRPYRCWGPRARTGGERPVDPLDRQRSVGPRAAVRQQALTAAEAWGIRPLPQAIAGRGLAERCGDAAHVLGARLAAAPQAGDAQGLDLGRLAGRLATLATQDGHLPILAAVGMPPAPAPLQAAPAGAAGLSAFEEAWLPVVAAVREPLAKLEVAQFEALIEGAAPLSVWTDRPDDPWQETVPRDPDGRRRPSRLRVAFGPAGVLDGVAPGAPVALGLVDGWAERVPETDQTAGVAFNFNAPSARAPSAILAVAPPDIEAPLDGRTLLGCLRHARVVARARTVSADGVGAFAAALSLALLPATGGMTDRLTGEEGER